MSESAEIARFPSFDEAQQRALVLSAVGISSRLEPRGGVVTLEVAPDLAMRARRQLFLYERENAPRRQPASTSRPLSGGVDAALAYCTVLVFLFAADQRGAFSRDWPAMGAAQAGRLLHGEWWRAVTALGLHADLGHLLGNLAFGVLFGLLAAQLLGSGLAWLAILLSGALANAINALLHPAAHTAIGASTAIFAALGILAGHRRRLHLVPWRGGVYRWAPLAAGTLLLVHLGSGGERTDVGAHVLGFLVGCAGGFILAQAGSHVPQGPRAQLLYGGLACGLFLLAWLLALRA